MKAIIHFSVALYLASSMNSAFAATITREEVALHASKDDCWIVVEGKVYDVTKYIAVHPAPAKSILDLCGKDATEGWRTKGSMQREHSQRAKALLQGFFKGGLRGAKD